MTVVIRPSLPDLAGLPPRASVRGAEFDPNLNDNTASATVIVQPSDDLAVTLAPAVAAGEVGRSLTLTGTILNAGPSPATDVTLRLPLTSGAQFVSGSAGGVSMAVQGASPLLRLASSGSVIAPRSR